MFALLPFGIGLWSGQFITIGHLLVIAIRQTKIAGRLRRRLVIQDCALHKGQQTVQLGRRIRHIQHHVIESAQLR